MFLHISRVILISLFFEGLLSSGCELRLASRFSRFSLRADFSDEIFLNPESNNRRVLTITSYEAVNRGPVSLIGSFVLPPVFVYTRGRCGLVFWGVWYTYCQHHPCGVQYGPTVSAWENIRGAWPNGLPAPSCIRAAWSVSCRLKATRRPVWTNSCSREKYAIPDVLPKVCFWLGRWLDVPQYRDGARMRVLCLGCPSWNGHSSRLTHISK